MTLHQKIAGVWTLCQRPYVKRSGIYTPVVEAYVKRSGAWVQAYEYDVVPPSPPELTLQIVDNYTGSTRVGSFIRVGTRLPGGAHDEDLKRIRVLTTYENAAPSTYLGGTYTAGSADNYPKEPWSEWRYDNYYSGTHQDSSEYYYKRWPRNAPNSYDLKPNTRYYFGAWSEDLNGNWSAGTFTSILTPRAGVDAENRVVKEASFQPNESGSYTSSGFVSGQLTQRATPLSRGIWHYGHQFTNSIGAQGTPTFRRAQILVHREDDGGSPTSNVYLFWHGYVDSGDLPGSSPDFNEITKLGTINKGESKWFNLPEAHLNNLNTSIKGFGLSHKDPVKASAFADDFTVIKGTSDTLRSGEVHIVWEEAL